MIRFHVHRVKNARPAFARLAALALAAMLAGCSTGGMSSDDAMGSMFVNPARYELYNCVQLRDAKREHANRIADQEALMEKARTGAAGSVVAEIAYRNDLNNARGNYNLADKVWQRNRCDSEKLPPEKKGTPPAATTVAPREPAAETANEQLRQIDQVYQPQTNR